jgi:hypothetical protein
MRLAGVTSAGAMSVCWFQPEIRIRKSPANAGLFLLRSDRITDLDATALLYNIRPLIDPLCAVEAKRAGGSGR